MLDVLIIDDEPLAVRRLEILLGQLDGVQVIGTATSATSGLQLLAALRPDIVLLDIEMPGIDGVALAQRLRAEGHPSAIIFVTAFAQFAIDAFDLAATDYLLKPVEPERLRRALDRVRETLEVRSKAARSEALERTVANGMPPIPGESASSLWLEDQKGRVRVPVADIVWLSAEGDYVRFYLTERRLFVRGKISAFAARLTPCGFVQIHRSAMVKASAVAKVEFIGDRRFCVTMAGGERIETSRRYAGVVRQLVSA